MVAPTGSGKTITGLSVAVEWDRLWGGETRGLVLVQSKELLYQWVSASIKETGWFTTMVGDGHHWIAGKIVIATTQAAYLSPMLSRLMNIKFDWLIIDECHRGISSTHIDVWKGLTVANPDLRLLGLTATPQRWDERGLRELFTHVAHITQYKELLNIGLIAKPIQIHVQNTTKEILYEQWSEKAGSRRTIVFTRTVDDAWEYYRYWKSKGVSCGVVSGDTPYSLRKRLEESSQVLFNVSVYIEGKDAPEIGCVVLTTGPSRGRYMQMVGRGLRPDTDGCVILAPRHHDIFLRQTDRLALGKGRPHMIEPIEPEQMSLKEMVTILLSWIGGILLRINPFKHKGEMTMAQQADGSYFSVENDKPDKTIEYLHGLRIQLEQRTGVTPNRVAFLRPPAKAVQYWCQAVGLTIVANNKDGLKLNAGAPGWMGYREGEPVLPDTDDNAPLNNTPRVVVAKPTDRPTPKPIGKAAAKGQKVSTQPTPPAPVEDVVVEEEPQHRSGVGVVEVDSSAIAYAEIEESIWTDDETGEESPMLTMLIVFQKNLKKGYRYWGMNETKMEAFLESTSPGTFYHEQIVGKYMCTHEDFSMEEVEAENADPEYDDEEEFDEEV